MEINTFDPASKDWSPKEELDIIHHLLGKLSVRLEDITGRLTWENKEELSHAVHHLEVGIANITNLKEQIEYAAEELQKQAAE